MSGAPGGHPGAGPVLVVGLGSADRGDDAVGPMVAEQVGSALPAGGRPEVHVVAHEDPTALIDLMGPDTGWRLVVVVDAVRVGVDSSSAATGSRSGPAPGDVLVLETGAGGLPLPARTAPGPAGTHGIGLAEALELARALDRLPPRVVVVGVVGADFAHGRPLSEAVAAAVPEAVGTVLAAVAGRGRTTSG